MEVEIVKVDTSEFRIWVGDDAVEEDFSCDDVGSIHISIVDNGVASNGPLDAKEIYCLWVAVGA